MQVIVKARHTRVPAALKELAIEKVERVRRFFDRITKLEIEFSEEHNPRVKNKHRVEVILATKAHVLRAEASGVDQASAIDAVVDKLEAQVKRMKDKAVKSVRPGNKPESIRIPSSSRSARKGSKADRVESAASSRPPAPKVRRTGRFSVEPMTPREAAMALDATEEAFLPFMNAETDLVSVVYRTDRGGFGFVEPAE
ncbi:MAG: ribosome-associated translation inhibitor RaiA [Actinomycetota bacterium]